MSTTYAAGQGGLSGNTSSNAMSNVLQWGTIAKDAFLGVLSYKAADNAAKAATSVANNPYNQETMRLMTFGGIAVLFALIWRKS